MFSSLVIYVSFGILDLDGGPVRFNVFVGFALLCNNVRLVILTGGCMYLLSLNWMWLMRLS